MERERRPAGLDGFFELLAQVTLVRPALPQLRSAVGVECGAMAERAPELLGGLAVDAQPGGPFPRLGRMAKHRVDVAGGIGVMGQARGVDRPVRCARQLPQHVAMELDAPVGGDRVLDRQTGELMAERDRAVGVHEHPRAQAGVEVHEIHAADRLEQPQLDPRGHDRRGLEQPARRRLELRGPRQHRVAHGLRQFDVGRGQRLGDEERIATGFFKQCFGIRARRFGHRADGIERQRRDVPALDSARAGQLSEHDLERSGRGQLVVAEGNQREHRQRLDPPARGA